MHMDFGGAQTEVSKEGHSLYNHLHICSPTGVPMQVHTVGSLVHMDMDDSCEFPKSGQYTLKSCMCIYMDFIRVQTGVSKLGHPIHKAIYTCACIMSNHL